MLKIKKLVPDSETGTQVIYYNKTNDYQPLQQIVLYTFDTNIDDSLRYMESFIKNALMNPQNYYLFITQQQRSPELEILYDVRGLHNFNIILDNWSFPKYFTLYEIPAVIVFNQIGQIICQAHPQSGLVTAALAEHSMNLPEKVLYKVYKKAMQTPENIISCIMDNQIQKERIYHQKLKEIHQIIEEHPKIIKGGKNFPLIQQNNYVQNIPQLQRKLNVKNFESVKLNLDVLLQKNEITEHLYDLQKSPFKDQSLEIQAQIKELKHQKQQMLDSLFHVSQPENSNEFIQIPLDPHHIIIQDKFSTEGFELEPRFKAAVVRGKVGSNSRCAYNFESDYGQIMQQINKYKKCFKRCEAYNPKNRKRNKQ